MAGVLARWFAVVALVAAGCAASAPDGTDASSSVPPSDPIAATTSTEPLPTTPTSTTTTSSAAPYDLTEVKSATLVGNVEFESRDFVEWGGTVPGCSLTDGWGNFLFGGAVVEVHDREGDLLGEGVLGPGETRAHIHCHFPYEVEVPLDADWYSVCVVGFGPAAPVSSDDLARSGWKTSLVTGGEPPEAPTPCDEYLGVRFGPLDDEGRPPPIDAETQWATMRSAWEQILADGYLNGYTIDYTISTTGDPDSDSGVDGDYRFVIADGIVEYCRFTPASESPSVDPCDQKEGTALSPVDQFYDLIDGFGREQVAVEFDLDAPIPNLIRHDRADTIGEEYTIRVTWFQGDW